MGYNRQRFKMRKIFFPLGIIVVATFLAAFTIKGLPCLQCHGEKTVDVKVDCSVCKGNKYDKWGDKCYQCQGRGYEIKKETCPSCKGSGEQTEPVPFPEPQRRY